jgi:signal transduction histidine kinase
MNKLKDEFLVTASHELRTPLSAIIGYASLLKRQSSRISPPQVLRFASKIGSAAQQLSDLVENMTEAAKMGAEDKKIDVQLEPVQVLSAAESVANMLAMSIEQKIVLNVDANLWVSADMMRFRQVLSNLLENAAKYSPSHGLILLSASAMPLVQVGSLLSEDQIDHQMIIEQGIMPVILVRVQDQGEGILPHDQSRIFEKFVRAPRSLTTPVRGSGLGLYISRRYVEAMGGKLWLEQSTPNEGSIFSFYIPRAEALIESPEEGDEVGFQAQ